MDNKCPAVHMYVGDIGSHFVQLFKRSDIGLALLMCRGCVADLLLFLRPMRIGRASCQGRRPGHTKGAPALLPGKQQVRAGRRGLSGEGGWRSESPESLSECGSERREKTTNFLTASVASGPPHQGQWTVTSQAPHRTAPHR